MNERAYTVVVRLDATRVDRAARFSSIGISRARAIKKRRSRGNRRNSRRSSCGGISVQRLRPELVSFGSGLARLGSAGARLKQSRRNEPLVTRLTRVLVLRKKRRLRSRSVLGMSFSGYVATTTAAANGVWASTWVSGGNFAGRLRWIARGADPRREHDFHSR